MITKWYLLPTGQEVLVVMICTFRPGKIINGQTPINLGSNVNTEFDEFRPILINEGVDNEKNMMIFSSNRDGGYGGFDLYYVGVIKRD